MKLIPSGIEIKKGQVQLTMMKTLTIILLLITISCSNQSSEKSKSSTLIVKEELPVQVDVERVFQERLDKNNRERLKKIETYNELMRLKEEGVVGLWECRFSGYESNIKIYKRANKFLAEVDFIKSNMKTKTEKLTVRGDKYFVDNNKSKEYYKIRDDRSLELGDREGLFTIAVDIMPGVETKQLPKFSSSNSIGKNIFTVVGNYSKSQPQTLKGTSNEFWFVFYADLNTEFKVEKESNMIVSAAKRN